MTADQIFILAEQTFNAVVQQITDAQFESAVPDWFEVGGSQDKARPTVREIINYHAYDTAWIPDTFAGRTIEQVGSAYDGDLLGRDPWASYGQRSERAVQAIAAEFDPERIVHFTYGDYRAAEAITHPTSFRIFRAYDVAKLIGADRSLPAELCDAFWADIEPHVGMWRQMGVFKSPIAVPEDADAQAALFARAGRDPDWRR